MCKIGELEQNWVGSFQIFLTPRSFVATGWDAGKGILVIVVMNGYNFRFVNKPLVCKYFIELLAPYWEMLVEKFSTTVATDLAI